MEGTDVSGASLCRESGIVHVCQQFGRDAETSSDALPEADLDRIAETASLRRTVEPCPRSRPCGRRPAAPFPFPTMSTRSHWTRPAN